MLVLSRKIGERIRIGDNIEVTVLDVRSGKTRLGIEGPPHIPVYRQEVCAGRTLDTAEPRPEPGD